MKFKNKVVLITGASKWIGKATAISFAKEGAIVVINYLNSEDEANIVLSEVNKVSQWTILKCDVSDEKQVKEMINIVVNKYGRLDILVNNAGWYIEWDGWNGSSEVWEKTLRNNLISAMNTSKYVTEIFQNQKSGIIVNVASRHSLNGQIDAISYAASKAWIVSITQAYSKYLTPFWRANSVSPWATNAGYRLTADKEELQDCISRNPYKRLIEPKEISDVILFLASDESKMITWQNILVDGWK